MNSLANFAPTPKEAIEIQKILAQKVIKENLFKEINYIAGVDVSNEPFKPDKFHYAAIVIMTFPALEIIERVSYSDKVVFPYIPGLLAFREVPLLIKALELAKIQPDIILVDGHGLAHPRGLGIASHLGVVANYVTIGCAKSILVGSAHKELLLNKGSFVPLVWKNEIIGNVLRTKTKTSPVYVSIGHKIDLETATEVVLECTNKYRIPEPLRFAHQYANQIRKEYNY